MDEINTLSSNIIVLLTDFGNFDGTVSELKGVIYSVDNNLKISDLTHEISPFNKIKKDSLVGNIISYDRYGNVWTNISLDIIKQYNFKVNNEYLLIIFFNQDKYFEKIVRFFNTFAYAKLE